MSEVELRYRKLFTIHPDGIVIVDMDTQKAIEFSDPICNNLGYAREEFSKLRVSNFNQSFQRHSDFFAFSVNTNINILLGMNVGVFHSELSYIILHTNTYKEVELIYKKHIKLKKLFEWKSKVI